MKRKGRMANGKETLPPQLETGIGSLVRRMRLPMVIASIVCSLGTADAAPAPLTKKSINSRKQGLNIRVEGGGWGSARKEAIETVLYSVADELLSRVPKKMLSSIVVTHTDSNPIALYERGTSGEYLVHLHAKDENWHHYVYEFAHELCHIMSNYEENVGADTGKYNQWFEETLCETASLFTLKSLAATWENRPPAPQWSAEAAKLRRFFDVLVKEGHRQLPPHSPLAAWLRDNERFMRGNPYLRSKNEVVANLLLPLFDRNPDNWDALTYLNLEPGDARNSLQDYLTHWYSNAPIEHKIFISRILALLWHGDGAPPPLGTTMAAEGNAPPVMNTAGAAGTPGD